MVRVLLFFYSGENGGRGYFQCQVRVVCSGKSERWPNCGEAALPSCFVAMVGFSDDRKSRDDAFGGSAMDALADRLPYELRLTPEAPGVYAELGRRHAGKTALPLVVWYPSGTSTGTSGLPESSFGA